jgi:hypothetical protein
MCETVVKLDGPPDRTQSSSMLCCNLASSRPFSLRKQFLLSSQPSRVPLIQAMQRPVSEVQSPITGVIQPKSKFSAMSRLIS